MTLIPGETEEPVSASGLEGLLRRDGMEPMTWSNGPGDRYGTHVQPREPTTAECAVPAGSDSPSPGSSSTSRGGSPPRKVIDPPAQ